MTWSKLSGGVINVVEGDPETGTITYISVACVDGTLRKYVGRLTLSGQSNVETATFKEYLVRSTTATLNEHLEWVTKQ